MLLLFAAFVEGREVDKVRFRSADFVLSFSFAFANVVAVAAVDAEDVFGISIEKAADPSE